MLQDSEEEIPDKKYALSGYTNARYTIFCWIGDRLYVLLVTPSSQSSSNRKWFVPGGQKKNGEKTPQETIRREWKEELASEEFDIDQFEDFQMLLHKFPIIQPDQQRKHEKETFEKVSSLHYSEIRRDKLPLIVISDKEKEEQGDYGLQDAQWHEVNTLEHLTFNRRHLVFKPELIELAWQIKTEPGC